MTLPQLEQVAITYAFRRDLWWYAALMALSLPVWLLRSSRTPRYDADHISTLFMVGMASGFLGYVLATQAKWQFCHPRSLLTPRFAAPHLAILASIAAVGFGLFPIWYSARAGVSPLAAAACSITTAASFIWMIHRANWMFGAIPVLLGMNLAIAQPVALWQGDDVEALHAAMVAAGWLAVAAWLRRLVRIDEEASDYPLPASALATTAGRMDRPNAARSLRIFLPNSRPASALADWWHDRLARVRAANPAARRRLLRYGFSAAPSGITAPLMAGMLFLIMSLTLQIAMRGKTLPPTASLAVMFVLMPGLMQMGFFNTRRPRMPQELLLPLARRDYIDGIFAAAGWRMFAFWLAMSTAAICLVPSLWTPRFLALFVVLSIAAQIYMFGVFSSFAVGRKLRTPPPLALVAYLPAFIAVTIGLNALNEMPDYRRNAIPPSLVGKLQPAEAAYFEQRAQEQEARWREQHQPRPERTLAATLALAAVGTAATLRSRRLWLTAELA